MSQVFKKEVVVVVLVVVVCWKRERQLLENILQKSSCFCL